ncbi:MAG: Gfo/Idh/MocA family oxidoreductase [Acidimicrobiales bacterium]
MTSPLRIGVLGAARISPPALFIPARDTDDVVVVAIAARDRSRAQAQADEFGIERVYDTYEEVLADPEVDAIYNPLPVNAHLPWGVKALEAGKHLLQEKPLTSNAADARTLVAAGERAGLVMMEAFHWRYHPLAARLRELLDAGVVGEISSVSGSFTVRIDPSDDVRHAYELSGGALMDLGCYPAQWLRFVVGAEPRVVSATMVEGRPNTDIITDIELLWDATDDRGSITGAIHTAMDDTATAGAELEVIGSKGRLHINNPIAPHNGHLLTVDVEGDQHTEVVDGLTTYHHQLHAYRDAIRHGSPIPTGGQDAIANMELIDAAYLAAGFPLRGAQ